MSNLSYKIGDATRPPDGSARVIVHVCNDVGGWGKGFVMAISRRWPEPERRYRAWHRGEDTLPFALGEVQLVQVEPELWVANLIGQHGLKEQRGLPPVRYDAIRSGLRILAGRARELGASVHMPRIGCGLAGGKWEQVEAIIKEELVAQGVAVTVYDLPAAPG